MNKWCVLLLHAVGIGIFIRGFLFIKVGLYPKSEHRCNPQGSVRRLLFVVIDALRFDYAKEHMARMLSYSNCSVFYESYADPPTVTLQRLKSIVTGQLPVFIEIGNNFDSAHHVYAESFIDHFYDLGNVSLMGDNTWVSLFGPRMTRVFTAPSFDVHDIHGVDKTIYGNFKREMMESDSSLIVGHFLGVDHAGHVFGYDSEEVKSKIREIDEWMFRNVLPNMQSDDMLMVLSDHGMTDSGSHGGASNSETSSFLYAYTPSQCMSQTTEKINQIDICPTVSLMFGFPIPLGNTGTAILDFFPEQSMTETAKAESEMQLSRLLALEGLGNSTHNAVERIRKKWHCFNVPCMILGLILMSVPLLFLPVPTSVLALLHSVSLFSDSFIFGENLVVQFFLGLSSQSPLCRVLGLFGRCREDTHKRICQPVLRMPSHYRLNQGVLKLVGDRYLLPLLLYIITLLLSDRTGETIHFLSLHGFFSLGHQFTFSDLHIEAGFAFGNYHPIVSPACIIFNTFLPDLIAHLFVTNIRSLQTYRTLDLVCISAFALYGRHHLMVWQVIAPRFLYQCALTLITDILSLFK